MPENSTQHIADMFFASKLILSLVANGVLATFGAVANYLYSLVHKGTRFHIVNFFVTAFLGFFIGNVVGNFLPASFPYRDGTLLVAGFVCYPILAMLEVKFPQIFLRRIETAFGQENRKYKEDKHKEDKHKDDIQ